MYEQNANIKKEMENIKHTHTHTYLAKKKKNSQFQTILSKEERWLQ